VSLFALANLACGFAGGYVVASLTESILHQRVSDAPNKTVKGWQRFPRLCRYMIRTRYSHHVVHHRGQLSSYLRPMGGKVPAIYGPSADAEE